MYIVPSYGVRVAVVDTFGIQDGVCAVFPRAPRDGYNTGYIGNLLSRVEREALDSPRHSAFRERLVADPTPLPKRDTYVLCQSHSTRRFDISTG